jgi:superfamily II DNA/RNA helicase
MSQFDQFAFPPSIRKVLDKLEFTTPTPIQAKAIPVALSGRDVMGMAQTGTGKTAAFALPLVVRLMAEPGRTALVLAPTRELAMQIHAFIKTLAGANITLKSALVIGGASMSQQSREFRGGARIFIATPGRLVDHLRGNPRLLQNASILVLDEADRMLDMGFMPQLKQILRALPKARQTLMFSATFPPAIKKLAGEFLRQPVEVAVGQPSRPIAKIEQSVVETTQKQKNEVLLDELNAREGSVLIFTRTKHRTDRLSRFLESYGYPVTRIHGNRTQAQRRKAIEGFRSGEFRILVATDIAARGLDIADIGHVINYDLPQVPEDYIHRIGRTARNGKGGQALCLLTPEDRTMWRAIGRLSSHSASC